ncbi:PilC/PilY family type IV pilus protein [Stenotrophomonas sp. 24(2023)]|uniref:pilus assembly protein n=1 Tax=Stenotrophomonas sp. 24(2023) TaxID=3068324 RepID=UPI0027DED524|nr:PilC/PilY family type IV pilus protein [Stenotrophomonas sp. 24(2023)]WMJ70939.1 PilC/PilY family type IV pilus protein [Stenotrophomonas sp. 24(2023)]
MRVLSFPHPTAAVLAGFCLGLAGALGAPPVQAQIAQAPLSSQIKVPGNLVLAASVEFPTLISAANIDAYSRAAAYDGYFDSNKCYRYVYAPDEADRHFEPVSVHGGRACPGDDWDGHYLNWATTQTIDPFRKALTGGYRVRDLPGETWLEKADFTPRVTVFFPPTRIPAGMAVDPLLVRSATPARWPSFMTRVDGLGARLYFTAIGNLDAANTATAYDPANPAHRLQPTGPGGPGDEAVIYELSVRVKVCVAGVGLERNCVPYATGAKPEGLLQRHSRQLRYSVLSYINNGMSYPFNAGGHETAPDGGVLRARQKFIGPMTPDPVKPDVVNAAAEWDPTTGVLYRNPDPADAAATGAGVADSGVINYINKFGQMKTGRSPKNFDNVSELYYAAARYVRGIGNVPEFSALSSDPVTRYRQADGFPVIQHWDDPMTYHCQGTTLLGIGDTGTWEDKNLPGPTSSAGEHWPKPAAVAADLDYDVVRAMTQLWRMEGHAPAAARARAVAPSFGTPAQHNSAYIAALAYLANTTDLRPDNAPNGMPGMQTMRTYWVDVVSNKDYATGRNQYVLATKYGGFHVPEGFDPFDPAAPPLKDAWWWNGKDLVNGDAREKRPRTFFAAADASRMVASLEEAFGMITQPRRGSGSALASNGGALDADGRVFSASYRTGVWRGDLVAHAVDAATGTPSSGAALWSAAARLDARDWRTRTLYTSRGGRMLPLEWSALDQPARTALGSQDVLDHLAGDRSKEGSQGLRLRASVLGDIVNSSPVHAGAPNPRLYAQRRFQGADRYGAFADAQASRRAMVYVGANDGLLHAFDAATGEERFAFMPATAITPHLRAYTREGYEHHYNVDGELTVADAYVRGAWRTVLVGTLGRGGAGVFALDVTDPDRPALLWERGAADVPGLGRVLGKPMVAQVADGDWRVLLGNGVDADDGSSRLVSISLAGGEVRSLLLDARGNGASAVRPWDADRDGFAETAYVGDRQGGVHRVDVVAGRSQRLFNAAAGGRAQPITAAPLVARDPATAETWVFIGTGALLEVADLGRTEVQSWYGLRDHGQMIAGRSGLSTTRIIAETGNGRVLDRHATPGREGWVMDLVSPGAGARGERMLVPAQFRGRVLLGTTRIPDASNPCNPAGSGYYMALDPFTGGRLDSSFFDMDGNGTVGNPDDLVGGGGPPVPSSGYLVGQGPNAPGFLGDWLGGVAEDGTLHGLVTQPIGNRIRRASWRELRQLGEGGQ